MATKKKWKLSTLKWYIYFLSSHKHLSQKHLLNNYLTGPFSWSSSARSLCTSTSINFSLEGKGNLNPSKHSNFIRFTVSTCTTVSNQVEEGVSSVIWPWQYIFLLQIFHSINHYPNIFQGKGCSYSISFALFLTPNFSLQYHPSIIKARRIGEIITN